jgi:hypothetical protein
MKFLAIVADILLLVAVIWLFATKGPPVNEDWIFLVPMILAPVLNIIVIFRPKGKNWFALYLERKVLEEQVKIDKLKKRE